MWSTPCAHCATSNRVKLEKRWIVWGHSQGGHSALWTGKLAEKIAPELDLIAVGAAPAAELMVIMQNQWNGTIGWVIGPEALVSFKDRYPDRDFDAIISDLGKRQLDKLLSECTTPAALQGAATRSSVASSSNQVPLIPRLGSDRFGADPSATASLYAAVHEWGTADTIVLSGVTRSCKRNGVLPVLTWQCNGSVVSGIFR